MKEKTAGQIMTPIEKVFVLPETAALTDEMMQMLLDKGFSRIPIQSAANSNDIVGALVVKKLIRIDHQNPPVISSLRTVKVWKAEKSAPLFSLMNNMVLNNIHMSVVMENDAVVGVLTLEDLMEEMIQEEIEDDPMNDGSKTLKTLQRIDRVRTVDAIERKFSGIGSPISPSAPFASASASTSGVGASGSFEPHAEAKTIPKGEKGEKGSNLLHNLGLGGFRKREAPSSTNKTDEQAFLVQMESDDDISVDGEQ